MRIPETLYRRLEEHAHGFDTPANVVANLLDFYELSNDGAAMEEPPRREFKAPASLEIIYHPSGESAFKRALLEKKRAYLRLFKTDGTVDEKVWNAGRITESASVRGNLASGYLRGWRDKGIYKAVLAVDAADLEE